MTLYSLLFSSMIYKLQSRLLLSSMIDLHLKALSCLLTWSLRTSKEVNRSHSTSEWKMWMSQCPHFTDHCTDWRASLTSAHQKLFLWIVTKTSLRLWLCRVGRCMDIITATPLQHAAIQYTSAAEYFFLEGGVYHKNWWLFQRGVALLYDYHLVCCYFVFHDTGQFLNSGLLTWWYLTFL